MITKDYLKTIFDYRDGNLYWKIKPAKHVHIGDKAGTLTVYGYLQTSVDKVIHRNHRLIFLMHHGYLPKYIDHINGDKSDNRIENLRECTISQNGYNQKRRINNTSGIKGISWIKSLQKWYVRIYIEGKCHCVGVFSDLEEAKKVAKNFREQHHKTFANTGY